MEPMIATHSPSGLPPAERFGAPPRDTWVAFRLPQVRELPLSMEATAADSFGGLVVPAHAALADLPVHHLTGVTA